MSNEMHLLDLLRRADSDPAAAEELDSMSAQSLLSLSPELGFRSEYEASVAASPLLEDDLPAVAALAVGMPRSEKALVAGIDASELEAGTSTISSLFRRHVRELGASTVNWGPNGGAQVGERQLSREVLAEEVARTIGGLVADPDLNEQHAHQIVDFSRTAIVRVPRLFPHFILSDSDGEWAILKPVDAPAWRESAALRWSTRRDFVLQAL